MRRKWSAALIVGLILFCLLNLRDQTGQRGASVISFRHEISKVTLLQEKVSSTLRWKSFNTRKSDVFLRPSWPNPAIVVGFPKSGTKSIADYFKCGCYNVSHYTCNAERKRGLANSKCGTIIHKNVIAGVDPLLNTGDMDVYTQLDVTEHANCYYPQIDALGEIHRYHPNSTFIMNTRDTEHWLDSVDRWGSLRSRFIDCDLTDLPAGVGERDADMISLLQKQVERIREFCKQHPSHALVEIDIESPSAGQELEHVFGIPSDCWGKSDHRGGNQGRRRKLSCSV